MKSWDAAGTHRGHSPALHTEQGCPSLPLPCSGHTTLLTRWGSPHSRRICLLPSPHSPTLSLRKASACTLPSDCPAPAPSSGLTQGSLLGEFVSLCIIHTDTHSQVNTHVRAHTNTQLEILQGPEPTQPPSLWLYPQPPAGALAHSWEPAHTPSCPAFKASWGINKNGGMVRWRDLQLALKPVKQEIGWQLLLQVWVKNRIQEQPVSSSCYERCNVGNIALQNH